MLERTPQVLPVQPVPERDHVAPLLWKSLVTVAVKARVPYPVGTDVVDGETLTEMGCAPPLPDLNAARPAPQRSEAASVAAAEAGPTTG